MKKLTLLSVFFALLFANNIAAGPADSTTSNVRLRTYLSSDEVPLNREVVYHVELSWQGELNRYHILEAGEPVLTNLKLRGSGSANHFSLDEQGNPVSKKTITYYFVSNTMGMAYVDGVIIKYEDKHSGLQESLISQRLGVKIVEAEPEPGKGADTNTLILVLFGGLFLLILAYFLNRYYMIRRKQKEMQAQKPPTPEESYLALLRQETRENKGEIADKFVTLSRLLQKYFMEKFDLSMSADFNKIKEALLKLNINEAEVNKIKRFYDQAELNKFAGEPIPENDYHLFYDTLELLWGRLNSENNDAKESEET